jgi:hypothetical protein
MSADSGSSRTWLLISASAAVTVAAAFGTYYFVGSRPAQAAAPDPQKIREQMQRDDLSDEQRRALREQMRAAMEARMDNRLMEYFSAPEPERAAVLDRHIDEFQKEMQEWERRRQEREQREAARGPDTQPAAERRGRPNFAAMTQQERKERMEGRSPDRQAQMMAYFTALRARAEARGIELPQWGPGRMGGGPGMGGGPRGGRP